MTWKNNNPCIQRCIRCRLHMHLCLCAEMPSFALKTRITLLMQYSEFRVMSNTGHLIPKMLLNSEIRFRGTHDGRPLDTQNLANKQSDPYILFPIGGAQELNREFVSRLKRPITLIVPDGNWRQAGKMIKRTKTLIRLPKLILPEGPPSKYRLRASPRTEGVCTIEAIMRALAILEGSEVEAQMQTYFLKMVDRVLYTRSKIRASEVYGGLPVAC